MSTVEIVYDDIPMEIVGIYTPYQYNGYEDPPDQEDFEIHSVKIAGLDIISLMDEDIILLLEEKAIEKVDNGEYFDS